jgi:hypothetical protein
LLSLSDDTHRPRGLAVKQKSKVSLKDRSVTQGAGTAPSKASMGLPRERDGIEEGKFQHDLVEIVLHLDMRRRSVDGLLERGVHQVPRPHLRSLPGLIRIA